MSDSDNRVIVKGGLDGSAAPCNVYDDVPVEHCRECLCRFVGCVAAGVVVGVSGYGVFLSRHILRCLCFIVARVRVCVFVFARRVQ